MKKMAVIISLVLVMTVQGYCEPSVVGKSSNSRFLQHNNNSVVSILHQPTLIDDYMGTGRTARVVVQDILVMDEYKDWNTKDNKTLTDTSVVNLGQGVRGGVLYNLDIYGYYDDEEDPGMDVTRRLEYNENLFLNTPVVVKINMAQVRNMLIEKHGMNLRPNELSINYFDPEVGEGIWRPLEDLDDEDISIEKKGVNYFITIKKWPKDDRVHCGR